MQTYELSEVLNQFILEGNFPTKIVWRRSINEAIKVKHDTEWLNRIKTSSDFCRFRDIHSSICIAKIWTFPNNSSELRTAYFVAKLLATVPVHTEQFCGICNRTFDDLIVHACVSCQGTQDLRNEWWDIIIENFPLKFYVELSELDNEQLFRIMLGKQPRSDICVDDLSSFHRMSYFHLITSSTD